MDVHDFISIENCPSPLMITFDLWLHGYILGGLVIALSGETELAEKQIEVHDS